MKRKHLKLIGSMILIGAMVCVLTYAGRHRETSLPAAVEAAIKALYPQAVIEEVQVEQEGLKVYEVELEQNRQDVEVTVAPDGTIVEVETDKRVFPVEVSCARCNHGLMDPHHVIDGHPPIRVTASFENKHGWLLISSLYGSHKVNSEHEIPPDTIVHMFCPHCHAELIGGAKCGECGAAMVPTIVRGGGVLQICTRRGCKGHLLDLGEATVD